MTPTDAQAVALADHLGRLFFDSRLDYFPNVVPTFSGQRTKQDMLQIAKDILSKFAITAAAEVEPEYRVCKQCNCMVIKPLVYPPDPECVEAIDASSPPPFDAAAEVGDYDLKCTNGHDRCYMGTSDDCPYCLRVAAAEVGDKCANCGYPKSEHHHAGACYGLCGEFVTAAHEKEIADATVRGYESGWDACFASTIKRCAQVALEQRCERGTPWDLACTTIAAAIRALMRLAARNDRRALKETDAFCPSCGHNRDKSSVSSIDHGDFKSCQKCGAEWTEIAAEDKP